MRRIVVIAVREYQAAVRTKAFIISLVAMPILWGGSIAAQLYLKDKVDIDDKRIAIVDYTERVFDAVADEARMRNESNIFEGEGEHRRQIQPKYLPEKIAPTVGDPARAAFELSERIRKNEKGDIMAFVIIGPDVIQPGEGVSQATVEYHSNRPTYDEVQEWLTGPINRRIQELRLQAAHVDVKTVEKAVQPVSVANLGLVTKDESGAIVAAQQTNKIANFFLPFGLMMLMFMVVMVGASPLMQSVLEEKTLRIAEVLLGSVSPFELMMGKLLGMVGVSLTMATVYLLGAFFALRQANMGGMFPAQVVWWFALFLSLSVLMYGAIFIAIGAAVSDLREAQSLLTPVMLLVFSPMFVWPNVIREPMSNMAVVLSLFPPATPMLMIIRQVVPPGIPLWQPLLGAFLVLLTTVCFVYAAGRIFRVGILMQGKGAKVSEMFRWVFRG